MSIKICNSCSKIYPATTEYFHKSKNNLYGLKNKCKTCCSIDNKKYYSANVPKKNYWENTRTYRKTRKGDISHRLSAIKHSYKFQNRNLEGKRITITTNEFISICEHFRWNCAYCGTSLLKEKPVISMVKRFSHGGDLKIENVVCSCSKCNKEKLAKTKCIGFERWYKSYQFYSEHRHKVIIEHIKED